MFYDFVGPGAMIALIFLAGIAGVVVLGVMKDKRLARVIGSGIWISIGAVFYDIAKMHMEQNTRYSFLEDLENYEVNIRLYRSVGVLFMVIGVVSLIYCIYKDYLAYRDYWSLHSNYTNKTTEEVTLKASAPDYLSMLQNTPPAGFSTVPVTAPRTTSSDTWECPSCRRKNAGTSTYCGGCFQIRPKA